MIWRLQLCRLKPLASHLSFASQRLCLSDGNGPIFWQSYCEAFDKVKYGFAIVLSLQLCCAYSASLKGRFDKVKATRIKATKSTLAEPTFLRSKREALGVPSAKLKGQRQSRSHWFKRRFGKAERQRNFAFGEAKFSFAELSCAKRKISASSLLSVKLKGQSQRYFMAHIGFANVTTPIDFFCRSGTWTKLKLVKNITWEQDS